jgi:hypothetical protein
VSTYYRSQLKVAEIKALPAIDKELSTIHHVESTPSTALTVERPKPRLPGSP